MSSSRKGVSACSKRIGSSIGSIHPAPTSRRSHSRGFSGRVQEAFAVLGGFPRAVYRAAKKNAAMAREQAHGAGQVHTKDYLAQRVGEGADQLHLDPFTAIGERLEKNAVRAAIERLPDAAQREVLRLIYVDGLAQSEVCELLKRDKTRVSRIHRAGVETVQKLLLLEAP